MESATSTSPATGLESPRTEFAFRSRGNVSASRAALIRNAALLSADTFVLGIFVVLIAGSLFLELTFVDGIKNPKFDDIRPAAELVFTVAFLQLVTFIRQGHCGDFLSFWCEARQLLIAALLAAFLTALFWPLPNLSLTFRLSVASTWLALPPILLTARQIVREILARLNLWRISVVVVAPPGASDRVIQALDVRRPTFFDAVKILECGSETVSIDQDWASVLRENKACRVVVGVTMEQPGYDGLMQSIMRSRVPFIVVLDNNGLPVFGSQNTRSMRSDTLLISYRSGISRPSTRIVKALIDTFLATILLIVIAPVILLLTLMVALDGGPVLFAHERVGEGGRRFPCYKFRSMVVNSDAVLQKTLQTNPVAAAEWATDRKLSRDPRITRIGVLLRRTSLDEIPQLLNVLRQEMSLVGPRPIVQEEISRYAEDIAFYYEARPGITGLWQVSGRSNTSYEQRVAYDRWYVNNWTLWHDFVILMMTLPAVLTSRGAR